MAKNLQENNLLLKMHVRQTKFKEAMHLLNIPSKLASTVILVTGTNGKTSTCYAIESLALNYTKKIGMLTSPQFFSYTDRIRIGGEEIDDELFQFYYDKHRNDVEILNLTEDEYKLLISFKILHTLKLSLIILEVEIGHSSSPFFILKSDLAIINTIDYDHLHILGGSIESIVLEKSKILTNTDATIIADKIPSSTLKSEIESLGKKSYYQEIDWSFYKSQKGYWIYQSNITNHRAQLPIINITLNSLAVAIFAYEILYGKISDDKIVKSITNINIPGHFQIVPGYPITILDVASNPQAICNLLRNIIDLELEYNLNGWQVVFAMQKNSLIEESVAELNFKYNFNLILPNIGRSFSSRRFIKNFLFNSEPIFVSKLSSAIHLARFKASKLNQGILIFGDQKLAALSLLILQYSKKEIQQYCNFNNCNNQI